MLGLLILAMAPASGPGLSDESVRTFRAWDRCAVTMAARLAKSPDRAPDIARAANTSCALQRLTFQRTLPIHGGDIDIYMEPFDEHVLHDAELRAVRARAR